MSSTTISGRTGVLAILGDPLEQARGVLTIHNGTADKAEALAARVKEAYSGVDVHTSDANPGGYDVVINATSLGMRPEDALPVDPAGLRAGMVAADVVIRSEPTPFLAAAAARGAAVQPGLPMLVEQIEQLPDFMIGPCGVSPAR